MYFLNLGVKGLGEVMRPAFSCNPLHNRVALQVALVLLRVRPGKNEDTMWRQHPLCPGMLPVRGKALQQHFCAPGGRKKRFWRFSETLLVFTTNFARVAKRVPQTFWEHAHVNNVAATMCPRFPGPNTAIQQQCAQSRLRSSLFQAVR